MIDKEQLKEIKDKLRFQEYVSDYNIGWLVQQIETIDHALELASSRIVELQAENEKLRGAALKCEDCQALIVRYG